MSPAALKRALDPAYIGSPFAQPFQFFDGDASTPMDLTGRAVVLFLDRQGLPDAHHEITGVIQSEGRVLFTVSDTSAWIKGDYSLEVRLDGASVVVGRIAVAKGAGANGSDIVGAAQPPTAPGVVIAGSGVVQVVSVAPSGATDPSAIILSPDLSAALGGAETLADALLWLAQNGGTPSPILRDLIGNVVISSVATGALSVAAAGQVLLSGAISSLSSATGSLTVGAASSIALVGSTVTVSSLTGAMTIVRQVALAGTAAGSSVVSGSLTLVAYQTLAADPDMAFAFGGAKLVSGYSGPLATACATNAPDTPTTTVQIFAGADGKADETAAIAAFGSTYHIWKWHDQTGLCADQVAATASARMARISTFPAFPFHAFNDSSKSYTGTTGSYDRSAFSLFEVLAGSMTGANSETTAQLGPSWSAGMTPLSDDTGRGVLTNPVGFVRSSVYMGVRPTVCSSVLAPTSIKIRADDQRQTLAATVTSASATGVTMGLGWQPASSKHHIAMVAYKRTLSDVDEGAIAARLTAIFAIPARASSILADGDSIQRGWGSTDNMTKWGYLQASLPSSVHIINAGKPGSQQTIRDSAFFSDRRIAGRKQVWMQNWGSNDFAANATAATLFGSDNTTGTRLNVANAKAAGFVPIIETVISRSNLTAAQNTERQTFNQLLRDNAAGLGYSLIDYGDTVYETTDGTHPTSAGYQAMAAIALPVIQAALAA